MVRLLSRIASALAQRHAVIKKPARDRNGYWTLTEKAAIECSGANYQHFSTAKRGTGKGFAAIALQVRHELLLPAD
ncbi:hypothetical protein [Pseudomonas sp. SBB6]|uniref:hypothetical protein n=1 Tax=Pseudomonas sp. SBB6 TaxID=2962032 RepID=UPI0020B8341A|nr:hypothetical protein [Pseudomonas sp. SBB6]MCP3748812.1 hypothetical protein [Pseudomonas sp. SBB6]